MESKDIRDKLKNFIIRLGKLFLLVVSGLLIFGKKYNFIILDLKGDIPEDRFDTDIKTLLGFSKATLLDIILLLNWAKKDNNIQGIIFRIGKLNTGLAKIYNLRRTILDFKSSGKVTVAFMEYSENFEYLLATACDNIYFLPTGSLNIHGLLSEVTFFKGILDKFAIEADFESVGKYKNAMDIFTRESTSKPHKEVINSILDDIYKDFVNIISKYRNKSEEEVKKIIDNGPYLAKEALNLGLIDGVLYEDRIKEAISELTKLEEVNTKEAEFFWKYARRRSLRVNPFKGSNKIALIYAIGAIKLGESNDPSIGIKTVGATTLTKAIRDAYKDKTIKAIILRVDSPGGSGVASDIIWREVNLAKEKKPFIVSMGSVAASGGYYISMAADTIVAEPATFTGSIGVIAGKLNLKGLYSKFGMKKEIFTRGENATIFSDYSKFSTSERKKIQDQLRDFYNDFVQKVSQGRKIPEIEVDKIAKGRVWTGNQAKEINLIDELGGIEKAIEIAKEKANIPKDEEVDLIIFPKKRFFPRYFFSPNFTQIIDSKLINNYLELNKFYQIFKDRILAILPYSIEIK